MLAGAPTSVYSRRLRGSEDMVWFCPVEQCSRHFERARGISSTTISKIFSFSNLLQLQAHCEKQHVQDSSSMGMPSPISEADVDKSAKTNYMENTDNANRTPPASHDPPPSSPMNVDTLVSDEPTAQEATNTNDDEDQILADLEAIDAAIVILLSNFYLQC